MRPAVMKRLPIPAVHTIALYTYDMDLGIRRISLSVLERAGESKVMSHR
jgi:hypothetical protein